MLAPLWLSLSLLAGATQDELPANWKTITPEGGGFTVAMPTPVTKKPQTVETATGKLTVTTHVAEGKNDSVFVVSHSDLPEADEKKRSIEKRLDHARDGAVSSARGTLRSEKAIDIDKHPGRDIVIEKDGEAVARMRIFVVNRRLYQVMVLGSGSAVGSKEASIFLDSFRLNK